MQFTIATALLVAGASASYIPGWGAPANVSIPAPVWETEIVTALTTYCPLATELTHGGVTYTVTKPTTLTITNCPCTITHSTSASTSVPTSAPYVSVSSPVVTKPVGTAPVVTSPVFVSPVITSKPVWTSPSAKPWVYTNATSAGVSTKSYPSASVSVTSSGPLKATANAATGAMVRSGAALAGVFGAVAYLL